MILDSARFIENERPHWDALAKRLEALDARLPGSTEPASLLEVHLLYRRAASGLARLESAAADPAVLHEVGALVARAYAEIHSSRVNRPWRTAWGWLAFRFPIVFRRQFAAFALVLWVTLAGFVVGGVAILGDRDNREILLPFAHLHGTPTERVRQEEKEAGGGLARHKAQFQTRFATALMANNIKVTINALALGLTYGLGTVVILFYNGAILGGVCVDYIADGQLVFLLGWLMPHGVVELPAVFIGGQAGFVLARALFGRGDRYGLRTRLRAAAPDLAALVSGAAALLVWAGLVESFFSQHHQPAIPYGVKIAFGVAELAALCAWLALAGRNRRTVSPP